MDAEKLAERIASSPEGRALKYAPPGTRRYVRVENGRVVVEHVDIPLAEIADRIEASIAGEESATERMARIALEAVDAVRAASKKMPPEAESLLSELRAKKAGREARLAAIRDAKTKGNRGGLLAILSGA